MNRYCNNDEKWRMYNFANDAGVMILGGSDYHAKGKTEIGLNGLTEEELDRIKETLVKSV